MEASAGTPTSASTSLGRTMAELHRLRSEQEALFREVNAIVQTIRRDPETQPLSASKAKSAAAAAAAASGEDTKYNALIEPKLAAQLKTAYHSAFTAAAKELSAVTDALERVRAFMATGTDAAADGGATPAAAAGKPKNKRQLSSDSGAAAAAGGGGDAKQHKSQPKKKRVELGGSSGPASSSARDLWIWSHDASAPLPVGTRVAALTDAHSFPRLWIEASIAEYLPARNRYKVIDEDPGDENNPTPVKKRYNLEARRIIPLYPLELYSIYQRREFQKGDRVLALFPGTTVLYPAAVLAGPRKRKSGDYLLLYDDDDEPERTADPRVVVPQPEDYYENYDDE